MEERRERRASKEYPKGSKTSSASPTEEVDHRGPQEYRKGSKASAASPTESADEDDAGVRASSRATHVGSTTSSPDRPGWRPRRMSLSSGAPNVHAVQENVRELVARISALGSTQSKELSPSKVNQLAELASQTSKEAMARAPPQIKTALESMMGGIGNAPDVFVQGFDAAATEGMGWLRQSLVRMSHSKYLSGFFSAVILGNAVSMWIEVDSGDDPRTAAIFRVINIVFVSVFCAELAIHIFGAERICRKDYLLIMDATIVTLSVVEISMNTLAVKFKVLTVFRVLRMVRLLRLFRAMHEVRPLRLLIATFKGGILNMMWVFVLLIVVLYVFGIIMCMMLQGFPNHESAQMVMQEHFGTVLGAMVTFLEVFLQGFDWAYDITAPLIADEDTLFVGIVFMFFVTFMQLCIVNLVIGIFVEQIIGVAKATDDKLKREQLLGETGEVSKLKKVFALIKNNKSKDGDDDASSDEEGEEDREDKKKIITEEEFCDAVKQDPTVAHALDIDPAEAHIYFESLDTKGTNAVSMDDFVFGIMKMKTGSKSVDMLGFDYQLKQIARLVNKAPKSISELTERFKTVEDRVNDVEATVKKASKRNNYYSDFCKRLERLEEQMERFMVALQVPERIQRPVGATVMSDGSLQPPMSIANLKDSYKLSEEMKKLRGIIEACSEAANKRSAGRHHTRDGSSQQARVRRKSKEQGTLLSAGYGSNPPTPQQSPKGGGTLKPSLAAASDDGEASLPLPALRTGPSAWKSRQISTNSLSIDDDATPSDSISSSYNPPAMLSGAPAKSRWGGFGALLGSSVEITPANAAPPRLVSGSLRPQFEHSSSDL